MARAVAIHSRHIALIHACHGQRLYGVVSDMFAACTAKCRTTSQSVQHENKYAAPCLAILAYAADRYRDPLGKYCFGPRPAALIPTLVK